MLTLREGSFENIESLYARVVDQSCSEITRFNCKGLRREEGIIIGRLIRNTNVRMRWAFQAIGSFFYRGGANWNGGYEEMQRILLPASRRTLINSGQSRAAQEGDSK